MQHRLLYLLLLFTLTSLVQGQQYGLKFDGNEVISEKRTSLILGKNYSICTRNDFKISFDFRLQPISENFYGYMLRLIDKNGRNFDILYYNKLRFVLGETPLEINPGENTVDLYAQTNHLELIFSQTQGTVAIAINGSAGKSTKISDLSFDCFELHFGQCIKPGFETKDVVAMNISDVEVSSNNRMLHHWKLDELEGSKAKDSKGKESGLVNNPNWISKEFTEWKELNQSTWKGVIAVAQEPGASSISVYHNDGIAFLDTKTGNKQEKKLTAKLDISRGDAAIPFDKPGHYGLVRLTGNQVFDFENGIYEVPEAERLTEYWHHNMYMFPGDTALVCIGGYGMYAYKNRFQKYSFQHKTWEDIRLSGDVPEPRYLAGFGNTFDKLTSYYIGGYGSRSGDQMLKPQNYYDFFRIDWKNGTVKELFKIPGSEEDSFVFASNLIINEEKGKYYGLVFNQLKFNTELQLIEGSLTEPTYRKLGKSIAINFHDVTTQVSLYEDVASEKLLCTVINHNLEKDLSTLQLFTISTPPSPVEKPQHNSFYLIWIIAGGGLITIFLIAVWWNIKRKRSEKKTKVSASPIQVIPADQTTAEDSKFYLSNHTSKPRINLFGKFQVLKADGTDLSKAFTPLIKEIFLYLLLNSLRYKKCLSSDKLDDIFWFDKTKASARNNRSVNLIKIKGLLSELGGIELDKETGNWEITHNPSEISIDYADFLQITSGKKKPTKEDITRLSTITGHGTFLPNLEFEWLDAFKSEISNKVIDSFLSYAETLQIKDHAEELVELADKVFLFDPVDETAMMMKCKALHQLGKHSLAKHTYEMFTRKYEDLFQEDFDKSFTDIIESR